MTPIHELLNRIRWDREFGRGRFELGYFDRQERVVHRVELQAVEFPAADRQAFQIVDETGQLHRIPFHRVREVLKNGQIIWQRPAAAKATDTV